MNIGAKAMTRGSSSRLLSPRSGSLTPTKSIFNSPMRETSAKRLNRQYTSKVGEFKTVNDKVLEELDSRANQLVRKRKLSDDFNDQNKPITSSAELAAAATRRVSRARKPMVLQRRTHKRYSIVHRREFDKMDSIANHYKVKVGEVNEPANEPSPAKKRRLLPPQAGEEELEEPKIQKEMKPGPGFGFSLRKVGSRSVLKMEGNELNRAKEQEKKEIRPHTAFCHRPNSGFNAFEPSNTAISASNTVVPSLRRKTSKSILQARSTETDQSVIKKGIRTPSSNVSSSITPALRRVTSKPVLHSNSTQSRSTQLNQSQNRAPTLKHSISTRSLRAPTQISMMSRSPSMAFSSATKSSAAKSDTKRLKSINLPKLP